MSGREYLPAAWWVKYQSSHTGLQVLECLATEQFARVAFIRYLISRSRPLEPML